MKFIEPFGAAPGTRYVDRDTPGAIVGSKIPADFPNVVMDELVGVIEKSGMTPDDVLQLADAIRSQGLNYFQAAGTANALTIAPDPVVTDYADLVGVPFRVKPSALNTGAVTLNVNGLGNKAIHNPDGTNIAAGRLFGIFEVIYTGTDFIITSTPGPATQAEVDGGVDAGKFLTPITAKAAVRFFDSRMTASQSLPNNTMTTLAIDAAIENGLIDSTTFATSKITVGARDAGVWVVMAYIQYTGSGNNKSLRIHRNGASTTYSSASRIGISQNGAGQANDTYTVTTIQRLVVGDQVSAEVLHTVGSTQTLSDGRFVAARISS
ncbi:hypothetical protein B5K11_09790 [Rhizobium leguminosarum bv. trifolii]|uniref:hypothetical protein n=1 Tax=Rhizobium leguminosarum TaxID=384 RepID=UPI000E2F5BF1|nr:hypothetical protein [Rhizobium leguminosarum]RFB95231.1 hypothetical protein B5K11_09790 [Rhizobium leguminosarum bv. trifolii]